MKALSEIQTELLVLLEYLILPSSFSFYKEVFQFARSCINLVRVASIVRALADSAPSF